MAATITERQRDAFAAHGLLRLPRFVPEALLAPARDAVLRAVSRHPAGASLLRAGEWQLRGLERDGDVAAGANLAKGAKRARALREVFTADLGETIQALLGAHSLATLGPPSLLFTLPNARDWTVPRRIWHVDLPRLPLPGTPGIQAFAFLDDVAPGGGGTLVATGSHRLLNGLGFVRSKHVKRALKREQWFRDLFGDDCEDRLRFMGRGGRVGDVDVQVAELHGKAGDVALTDIRLLHTLAPNTADVPRMMATQRYLREDAHALLGQGGRDGQGRPEEEQRRCSD